MKRDRFDFVCQEAQSGLDSFVKNPNQGEEGRVLSCSLEHVVVSTSEGYKRCWDYHECEEMVRTKEEWPRR